MCLLQAHADTISKWQKVASYAGCSNNLLASYERAGADRVLLMLCHYKCAVVGDQKWNLKEHDRGGGQEMLQQTVEPCRECKFNISTQRS